MRVKAFECRRSRQSIAMTWLSDTADVCMKDVICWVLPGLSAPAWMLSCQPQCFAQTDSWPQLGSADADTTKHLAGASLVACVPCHSKLTHIWREDFGTLPGVLC